jgi:hypothetical protein
MLIELYTWFKAIYYIEDIEDILLD